MASPWDSTLWGALGQASNVVQLVGVDAVGLVSMVVQAALAARRHRDACVRLAQHVELVGGLLQELELAELMRWEATRRPLEQLGCALRRCYALVSACQDCGYLRRLLLGARMADELRAAQHEIDMFIRLIPLIALVDNFSANKRRVKAEDGVLSVVTHRSNRHIRFPTSALEFTEVRVQRATELCHVGEQPFLGKGNMQEQKTFDIEELVELCARIEEACTGFVKFNFFQIVDATDNFSENKIIGLGGFGTVYKGQFSDGLMVAIKRLDEHATNFDSELQLAKLHHANLISGYKAPEYASQGVYSMKTDVFSFGVCVLVIISGRKNTMHDRQGDTVGDLVRAVSDLTIYFKQDFLNLSITTVCFNTWPIYIYKILLGRSSLMSVYWKTISGMAYVEGPKVA
ncbi:hypothetical protein ACQ4PT_053753 [Festuca glaucescens]